MFAIKVHLTDPQATNFDFASQKTMYGGKAIAVGDEVFIFDSENEGGPGLVARGRVTAAQACPKLAGVERQTPRVSIRVLRSATASRPMGRSQLKLHRQWDDGRPETELNFKLYRQATNKIVGLSAEAAALLGRCF